MSDIIFKQKEDIEMLKYIVEVYCGNYTSLSESEIVRLAFKYIPDCEIINFIKDLYTM